ncbi:MAG TPA: uridine kinase [Firmicutes bacterium]|nr:uridine kinase [Bacillota bacterium]
MRINNLPYVVGIAGGTGSGKSTLSERLKQALPGEVVLIRHDNYYHDQKHVPFAERVKVNYDHPLAFETDLLIQHLDELRQGRSIYMPEYDFTQHVRKTEEVLVEPRRIILVEGILVLENAELRERLDLRIFVDTDSDTRILRRLVRDINERQRTLESVIDQYLRTVKPMHEQFVEPSKRYADIIVPEGGQNQVAIDMIVARLRAVSAT